MWVASLHRVRRTVDLTVLLADPAPADDTQPVAVLRAADRAATHSGYDQLASPVNACGYTALRALPPPFVVASASPGTPSP